MFLICSIPVGIGRVAGSTALPTVAAHPSSADKDPMNDDREIQDTDTDRRAIQLLLGSFSGSASVDPMTSPVEDVDAVWRRMAVHLATPAKPISTRCWMPFGKFAAAQNEPVQPLYRMTLPPASTGPRNS